MSTASRSTTTTTTISTTTISLTTLPQIPLHVLGLVLSRLDTLSSLGAAVLAHPALHAAFVEDPARITRDILDAQMSPATARLAYAAYYARRVPRSDVAALRRFADDWLVPLDDTSAATVDSEGGPLGVWPWGLSLADVVGMSRAHGVVEALTKRLVEGALPGCAALLGGRTAGGRRRATEAEITRIHRMLYGYEIYCGLLFRDAGDCAAQQQTESPAATWRTQVNAQLSAALYRDNVARAHSQLACIHDFLEDIVLQAFKQVAMYDVTWGANKVDYLSTGSANEHVQAYLSLGLDYIYKLSIANTPLPPDAAPDARLQHFRRLRQMLLTHRYSSTSTLPPRTAYMLASELATGAHPNTTAAAAAAAAAAPNATTTANNTSTTAAVERRHARHLWDEPIGPASSAEATVRRAVIDRWVAEEAAREKVREETERPAMKRSWARREVMHSQGYRGFYMEHA